MNTTDIESLIENNPDIRTVLTIIQQLDLKDSWLCAGTIRNYIWNCLSGKNTMDFDSDVDVIFFDPKISYEQTLEIEKQLLAAYPKYNWELKNQVYMHIHNPNTAPYQSSREAISSFPEKCTAIGARLVEKKAFIELYAPYGIEDILNFQVSPTPLFSQDPEKAALYNHRVKQKNWGTKWPQLTIQLLPIPAIDSNK